MAPHKRCCLIKTFITINWVSKEQHGLDFWELRKLSNFIPILNSVVSDEESMQFDARIETFKLFDLVIGQPQLLQGLTDLIKTNDSLNIVSSEGQDFQHLKFWQVDDSFNLVS